MFAIDGIGYPSYQVTKCNSVNMSDPIDVAICRIPSRYDYCFNALKPVAVSASICWEEKVPPCSPQEIAKADAIYRRNKELSGENVELMNQIGSDLAAWNLQTQETILRANRATRYAIDYCVSEYNELIREIIGGTEGFINRLKIAFTGFEPNVNVVECFTPQFTMSANVSITSSNGEIYKDLPQCIFQDYDVIEHCTEDIIIFEPVSFDVEFPDLTTAVQFTRYAGRLGVLTVLVPVVGVSMTAKERIKEYALVTTIRAVASIAFVAGLIASFGLSDMLIDVFDYSVEMVRISFGTLPTGTTCSNVMNLESMSKFCFENVLSAYKSHEGLVPYIKSGVYKASTADAILRNSDWSLCMMQNTVHLDYISGNLASAILSLFVVPWSLISMLGLYLTVTYLEPGIMFTRTEGDSEYARMVIAKRQRRFRLMTIAVYSGPTVLMLIIDDFGAFIFRTLAVYLSILILLRLPPLIRDD